jgi:acyl carrier protein
MKITLLLFITIAIPFDIVIAQQRVRVNAIQIDDSFDTLSIKKLHQAEKLLYSIFNSQDFKTEVTRTKFNIGNYGFTSMGIYELIVSGTNDYKEKVKDYSIDLKVGVFDAYLGYDNFGTTDMKTRITRTHRCYILDNDVKCYASHLAHEYMHQIGFLDNRTWILGGKAQSVPYKIGKIVDRLINNDTTCFAIKKTCKK